MFNDLNVLVVRSPALQNHKDIDKLVLTIENNDGTTFVKDDHDNSVNYFDKYEINHIITASVDFIEYDIAKAAMIPMTTPDWVYDSVKANKPVHQTKYNPDTKLFLKNCFICIGDDIPVADKEIIYGGVKAFGGLYLDMLTTYTTHLITNDLFSDKSILARSSDLDIKLVKPQWIDESFKMGKKMNEKRYILQSQSQLEQAENDGESSFEDLNNVFVTDSNEVPNQLKFNAGFLNDKRFFISEDYRLSSNIRQAINSLILKNGGKISSKFSDKVDIYIGKYRHGKEFQMAFRSNRIILGNLQWLYFIVLSNKWVLPVNSQLLHYPIPMKPIPDFKGLKISVTNYSHDARYYLSRLITILGGTFTKNLSKENDYLIVGKPTGEKYSAASSKWVDANGQPIVTVVNHLWLEECYSNWELIKPESSKYKHLGYDASIGIENLLGRTKLNKDVLNNWVDSDVDDSMEEDLLKPSLEQETDYSTDQNDEEEDDEEEDEKEEVEQEKPEQEPEHEVTEPVKPHIQEESQSSTPTPTVAKTSEQTSETPEAEITPISRGRSAKAKAALRLHDDMNDLAKYQELAKSSRKMKSYMQELENSTNKRKAKSADPEDQVEKDEKKNGKENITPPKKKGKPSQANKETSPTESMSMVAIMTGCESEVDLNREDIANLKNYGVKISNDMTKINTLIAPKILRTEKFLTSLSKVENIIHPSFIVDLKKLLKQGYEQIDINVENYRLDKVLLVSEINKQLGYSAQEKSVNGITQILSGNRGSLFTNYRLNLSNNLNGGYDVLSKILKNHGVEELKLINGKNIQEKQLLVSELEQDQEKIIIVNKAKDQKIIKSFTDTSKVVEWDWCVKSIFKQQIENFEHYLVK